MPEVEDIEDIEDIEIPQLTIVMTYFNNPEMMKIHLATWHTYPTKLRAMIQFIVVDDHSDPPLEIDEAVLNLTVLRVDDDITWNLPGARNLGADYCETDWFMMVDTDMLLTAEMARRLLDLPKDDPKKIYNMKHQDAGMLQGSGFSANMVLISKELFWKCWGYDEDFSGSYGGQEGHLRSKLLREGGDRTLDHFVMLTNFGEDDAPRIVEDAKSSTPEMKTEEGLKRARQISGRKYNNTLGIPGTIRSKQWNRDVLRFKWHVAQEFKYVHIG